ncbi:MAG: hypothetical protein ABS36_02680 [Acidobacteria bacterium SCN 69-37]|nr:MAG: hypothetical protein ABS36_02680 [Acidobacteria bacterium SCN 69-37]
MAMFPLTLLLGLLVLSSSQAPATLSASIDALGSFDFATRTAAARAVRRAPAAEVVPALEAAARTHADQYVRFRALVLLSGIDAATTSRVTTDLIADRNDRVRTVAYQWLERHPQPALVPRLLASLPSETSEFVRPALTRALVVAAVDNAEARETVRSLVLRGEDLFRGTVIAAIGDHRAAYALPELLQVVPLDGPLQDDTVTAIGRIGDVSTRNVIAGLQAAGSREIQPGVSAALCLLQVDCEARIRFVIETLRFAVSSDRQIPLLRGAVHAAGVLASAGHTEAFEAVIDTALASTGAVRDALTLGLGSIVLRQPALALQTFEARRQAPDVAALFQDSFDMLSEDFDEEQLGADVRRAFWAAAEGSARRTAAASLLDALEF